MTIADDSWLGLVLLAEIEHAANRAWWSEIRRHRDCRTCAHARSLGACAFDPGAAGVIPRTKRWTPFLVLVVARALLPQSADDAAMWPHGPSAPLLSQTESYYSKAGKQARRYVGCPHWRER